MSSNSFNIYQDLENRVPRLTQNMKNGAKTDEIHTNGARTQNKKIYATGSQKKRVVLGALNINSNSTRLRIQPRRTAKQGVSYDSGAPKFSKGNENSNLKSKSLSNVSNYPFSIYNDEDSSTSWNSLKSSDDSKSSWNSIKSTEDSFSLGDATNSILVGSTCSKPETQYQSVDALSQGPSCSKFDSRANSFKPFSRTPGHKNFETNVKPLNVFSQTIVPPKPDVFTFTGAAGGNVVQNEIQRLEANIVSGKPPMPDILKLAPEKNPSNIFVFSGDEENFSFPTAAPAIPAQLDVPQKYSRDYYSLDTFLNPQAESAPKNLGFFGNENRPSTSGLIPFIKNSENELPSGENPKFSMSNNISIEDKAPIFKFGELKAYTTRNQEKNSTTSFQADDKRVVDQPKPPSYYSQTVADCSKFPLSLLESSNSQKSSSLVSMDCKVDSSQNVVECSKTVEENKENNFEETPGFKSTFFNAINKLSELPHFGNDKSEEKISREKIPKMDQSHKTNLESVQVIDQSHKTILESAQAMNQSYKTVLETIQKFHQDEEKVNEEAVQTMEQIHNKTMESAQKPSDQILKVKTRQPLQTISNYIIHSPLKDKSNLKRQKSSELKSLTKSGGWRAAPLESMDVSLCDSSSRMSLASPFSLDSGSTSRMALESPLVLPEPREDILLKKEKEFWDVPEYADDIFQYLQEAEQCHRPRLNYMAKQTDITASMRWILVDWLVEVGEEYSLQTETLHLAVSYIDRFLSHMSVKRDKLQLVGTTAMFIAAKYEEIYPPDVTQFAYITDNTYRISQILRMEHLILKVLSFDMAVPSAYLFLTYYASINKCDEVTKLLAMFLCELSMLDFDPFMRYVPSKIAAAALALANFTQGKETWSNELKTRTRYCLDDLRECYVNLHRAFVRAAEPTQHAIRDKYKSVKLRGVSMLPPKENFPW